ncbi:MAG: Methyltransferase type 11 [Candidatus Woesebacteria bacterium GW2011_GWB1_39_10]|uniref:Methyltransferase type 11 n=1 Tax=Candidatus Woesebacteria bacterium GW2011_GWB1_39_10 TaxID=1618572 RepID=A0A0G0P051_9BACT|nr:MAG: Methyltransferase type 11 [Candidatus Woesebacteria bacterium GW2011_GWB1_39_10]
MEYNCQERMGTNMSTLNQIIKPKLLYKLKIKKGEIPNFLTRLDKNSHYQADIWSDKTYKVDPKTHVFTTIQEHFGNRLIKSIKLKKNSVVVDVGCFIGEKLWQINNKLSLGIGVDIAIPSLKAAQDIDIYGNKYIAADLENLPFKDNSVDLVMVFDVIEHLTHAGKGFSEVARVLKPNGQFLLHIPIKDNKWSFFGWKQKLSPKEAQKEYFDVGHAPERMLTSAQIKSYLKKNNLKIEKEIFYNSFLVHFFDRELNKLASKLFVNLLSKGKSKVSTTRSVHTGKTGKIRNFYGEAIVPILEFLSWPDWILSKLKVGNTYFVLAQKK